MNKQLSLSFFNDELKEVKTQKKEFLAKIEKIMTWSELKALVEPCYYEGKRGNKPYDLELMLRIHLLQNLYDLSDEGTRNEVIDSRAFSDFCGVESKCTGRIIAVGIAYNPKDPNKKHECKVEVLREKQKI